MSLFQEIAPVDDTQAALTARHLIGISQALAAYFLALRAETDAALTPLLPDTGGKRYPYGRCEEITRDVHARLSRRLERPNHIVEHALRDFVAKGGALHTVWGVLREQYFQNALQLGGLYVDVANDTVVVTKPKVEILPIEDSGLVGVRDIAHFRQTAERYWGATMYANHLVPSLAPLLPMFSISPGRLRPGLQSACDYMIELMRRDEFRQAEDWLRQGPPPPPEMAAVFLATVPPDLRPQIPGQGREEALTACQRARAANARTDLAWRNARVMDFLRLNMPARA